MSDCTGTAFTLTVFGESHGPAIGAVVTGLRPGTVIDEAFVARRWTSAGPRVKFPRPAPRPTGCALYRACTRAGRRARPTLLIENENTRSGDYAKTADLLRPGHADYTAYAKYHGFQDARGGGHFSGRITAALVAGGAIVLGALNRAGIDITTHIARCAGISDTPFALDDAAALAAQVSVLESRDEGFALLDASVEEPMKTAIRAAGSEGDSVGGILETAILGLPARCGRAVF